MNIAIDITPLSDNRTLSHKVRGSGFYVKYLKDALLNYDKENTYMFFEKGAKLSGQIDLIHYPYFEPFFLTLPLKNSTKTVVTVHDLTPIIFPQHFPSGVKGKIKWHMQKLALKKADHIITDSFCSKKDIMKYTGIKDEKISVTYLAAGEEFKRIKYKEERMKHLKEKYHLPDEFMLYVGDVTWNKNIPRLLEAVLQTDMPIVMVGKTLVESKFDRENPWNKDLIKAQNVIVNNKQIIPLGFIQTDDLVALYNIATALVMPSLYEGFGLPILEAMQCGCPVITSKEGSLHEVAGDAAYYVDAYDSKSIAEGIQTVAGDKKLQATLTKKGKEHVKKFSWEKTAKDTMAIYNRAKNEYQ